MIERGGALKELQLRDAIIANTAMANTAADGRRVAEQRQKQAEKAQAVAEVGQKLVDQRQAAVEATLAEVEATLDASRDENNRLAAEVARLAAALQSAMMSAAGNLDGLWAASAQVMHRLQLLIKWLPIAQSVSMCNSVRCKSCRTARRSPSCGRKSRNSARWWSSRKNS